MQHAVDFIIETIMKHPGEITLVAGWTINKHSSGTRWLTEKIQADVKEIVLMGRCTRLGSNRIKL